jgi:hypothetical protein
LQFVCAYIPEIIESIVIFIQTFKDFKNFVQISHKYKHSSLRNELLGVQNYILACNEVSSEKCFRIDY